MRPLKAARVAFVVLLPIAKAQPQEAGSLEEIWEPRSPIPSAAARADTTHRAVAAIVGEQSRRCSGAILHRNVENGTLPVFIVARRCSEIHPLQVIPIDTAAAEPSLTCPVTSFQRRHAGALPPPNPPAVRVPLAQREMIRAFDTTSLEGGPWYVNDHTLVQAPDGSWHLFGIFHHEPMNSDTEVDFIHAVSSERDLAKWKEGIFRAAPGNLAIALTADRSIGETHLWAPHVIAAKGHWFMVYQGGGEDGDHSSIRLAESDDLYRWTRVSTMPLFEDFCVARDPMLVRRGSLWSLYYTRCESQTRRVSGVAHRTSSDLIHWSEPKMALSLGEATVMPNSGYTESPFVFEHGGYHYLSVTSYPLGWDATFVYRSRDPFAFPDTPFSRVRAHAAEWVFDREGRAYVTHAGSGQRGVWISQVALPGAASHETSPSEVAASPR